MFCHELGVNRNQPLKNSYKYIHNSVKRDQQRDSTDVNIESINLYKHHHQPKKVKDEEFLRVAALA